ncbi:MAG TPA: CPBP family intramembrane metalloprotease [Caldilineaceae bacterium]|nr:CPBP family intramembrane metalloprotease [Caldilineaceae bacterium]
MAGVIALVVANLAQRQREQSRPYGAIALVSYLVIITYYGVALFSGLRLLGVLGPPPATGTPATDVDSLTTIGWGLALPALGGILLLAPVVRRQLARLTPIDPDSPVHALALSLISLVITNLTVTLGVGLGNLANSLEQGGASEQGGALLGFLWAQQLMTALLAFIGVGWLTRRSWGETLQRLGLVRPTWRQVGLGIGLALLLVPLVIVVEYLSQLVGLGENADVENLSKQLFGPLSQTAFGIITVGAAAPIGEETLLRGALLPRFGLLLTTLIFALLHSNYGLSISTVVVFILGIVLGIVRLRANTTTSMIVHGVYNSTLALLVYLGM